MLGTAQAQMKSTLQNHSSAAASPRALRPSPRSGTFWTPLGPSSARAAAREAESDWYEVRCDSDRHTIGDFAEGFGQQIFQLKTWNTCGLTSE